MDRGSEFFSLPVTRTPDIFVCGTWIRLTDSAEPTSAVAICPPRIAATAAERLADKLDKLLDKILVAGAALDAGASIINDVTAGRADTQMLPLAATRVASLVLMHMQGEPSTMQKNPQYGDVVREVADFFRQQYACAIECGVDPMRLAFDPGIGFGKTLEHNLSLLKDIDRLRVHDRPLVVGVSRKSFLGKLVDSGDMSDRLAPTIAMTSILRSRGADVLRVHDVKENVAALRVTERML